MLADPFAGDHQKAALIVYDSLVREQFDFNDAYNTHDLQSRILATNYSSGITLTEKALEYAQKYMFTSYKGKY